MEEPKKLIMTVESNQRKYSYGSAATWTETACMSGFTR